jgi:hypothetical protein
MSPGRADPQELLTLKRRRLGRVSSFINQPNLCFFTVQTIWCQEIGHHIEEMDVIDSPHE